jgi:hypothetical protein
MECQNIRDRYDLNDHYESEIAKNILWLHMPMNCETTTGLDSLVVVIRRLYAYIMTKYDGRAYTQQLKDAERENPILRYAWHFMGRTAEQQAAAKEARPKSSGSSVASPKT